MLETKMHFYGSDYFAIGAFLGVFLTYILRKGRHRLWAPLFIPLSGLCVAFPYILFKTGFLSKEIVTNPLFNFYFSRIKVFDRGAISLLILLMIFSYTCLYYIKYSKELLAELQQLEQHAK